MINWEYVKKLENDIYNANSKEEEMKAREALNLELSSNE